LIAAGDAMQQAIEQFDRRCFVAMDAGRQQQVQAIVARFGGRTSSAPSLSQRMRTPSTVS
jgi:hypothetical protein